MLFDQSGSGSASQSTSGQDHRQPNVRHPFVFSPDHWDIGLAHVVEGEVGMQPVLGQALHETVGAAKIRGLLA